MTQSTASRTLLPWVFSIILVQSMHSLPSIAGNPEEDGLTLGRVTVFEKTLSDTLRDEDTPKEPDTAYPPLPQAPSPPPSPSQLASSLPHWWEREQVLTLVLLEAEAEYKRNLLKKMEVDGGGNPPYARFSPPPGSPPGPSPFTFMDRKFIATYPCPFESRLGAWGDGGKWVCLSHYKSSNTQPVVVSVGSNGDTSFEKAIFDTLGVSTHTLDFSLGPSIEKEVSSLQFIHFHKVGLTGKGEWELYKQWFKDATFLTFPEAIKLVGENYIDIFKVDCENCEYELVRDLGNIYTRENVPIGQIQLELHKCANITKTTELFDTLEDLGFRMFHTEINLYGAGFGNWQFEVALIHEGLVKPRELWGR